MFPQITISGSPHERGRQYGQAAAGLVRHSIASYARLFAYKRGEDWQTIQQRALAYVPVLEEYAADLLEEMRGIAVGSCLALSDILALNARTELLAGPRIDGGHPGYPAARGRNRAAAVPDHGECTTVAALPEATAGGATLLAQTWDWNGDQRAACVLLRIQSPNHPEILTLTEAGIVAKIGLNRAGVGVCLNILQSHADGLEPGMPVHVLLRRMLHCTSFDTAVAEATQVRSGASSCITVAGASGQAASLEVTPGGVGVVPPRAGLLVHTNHCVTATTQPGACALPANSSSVPRFDRATALLEQAHGRVDTATLKALLRDHTDAPLCICRHPDPHLHPSERTESVTGIVMDLRARVMGVAAGVPCLVPFDPLAL